MPARKVDDSPLFQIKMTLKGASRLSGGASRSGEARRCQSSTPSCRLSWAGAAIISTSLSWAMSIMESQTPIGTWTYRVSGG